MAKRSGTVRYRDKKTGRFVSASTWKRSKAQGGKRYTRIFPIPKKRKKRPILRPAPLPKPRKWPKEIEEFEEIELVGGFDSPGRKKK